MALGFPESLYNEIFGDDPKAITSGPPNPLKVDTELAVELGLVAEYANGSMELWNKRSWGDRRMWLYFKLLQNAKIKYAEDNAAKEIDKPPMPAVVQHQDRPGIRN